MDTSTNTISIRPYGVKDLQQLAAVYIRAYTRPDESWNETTATKLLTHWLERQSDLCFLAECDSKPVGGFMVAVRPWWNGNHLIDGELFVDPDYQNRGIGKELLRTALQIAKEKYAPVLWETWTFCNQEFPLSWYKRIGFKEIEQWIMLEASIDKVLSKC